MNQKKKILITLIICFLFISINLSGCISTEFLPPPSESNKHPNNPVIGIDNDENIYFLWKIYESGKYFINLKIFNKINEKIKERRITEKQIRSPKLIIDSQNNLFLFFLNSNSELEYLKIDKNGNILFNSIISKDIFTGESGYGDTSILFNACINDDDEIFIIWLTWNSSTAYIKFKNNLLDYKILNLGYFITNITYTLHTIDFSFYSTINSNNIIWTIWSSGGNTYNINTNSISGFNTTYSGNVIKADSKGNVYIRSGIYIKKFDNVGNLISKEKLSNIRIISNYPVIESEGGKYIYIKNNGCIDSDNNLHIVNHQIESKIWETTGYVKDYFYYTIYYSKIAPNGTKLIDNMTIDSDGEPSWETGEYANQLMIMFLIIAIPAVIILLIFIKFFIFKKKKKEGNIREQQKRF